jgi:aspartate/methionine/tyrosine aminotransferase
LDVISLFSFSKSYGISGWRVGYAVFPEFLNESMLKVQDTSSICATRISQRLALELLKEKPPVFGRYMNDLMNSRQQIISFLGRASDLIEAPIPQGAFYSLPRSRIKTLTGGNSMDLVVRILEKCRVLVVPGDPFGAGSPPSFRISYGNVSCEMLNEALERMERNLSDLLG